MRLATAGLDGILLEVVTQTLDHDATVMLDRLGGLAGVSALQTSFALRTTKTARRLPLGHLAL